MLNVIKNAVKEVLALKESMDALVRVASSQLNHIATAPVRGPLPCGIVVFGERAVPLTPEVAESDSPVVQSILRENRRGIPFIAGNSQLLMPDSRYEWGFSPDTNVANLTIIAYGPCTLLGVRIKTEDLSIWSSDLGGPCAVYKEIVAPSNRIHVKIQSWKW